MKKILITIILILLLPVLAGAAGPYFVRDDGNDSNTGLSDAQAWLTIAKVNSFAFTDGDDVYFKCDDTWSGTRLVIDWDGVDADNKAIIGAYYGAGTLGVSGNRPIIDGDSQTVPNEYQALISYSGGGGHVTIRDLKVANSNALGIQISRSYAQASSYHNLIQNCWTYRTRDSGIMLARVSDSAAKDNIVEQPGWNRESYTAGGIYSMAMDVEGRADRNEISGNTVFGSDAEGIGAGKKARWTLIENNIVYDCRNVQIYAASSKYSTIRNNIIYRSASFAFSTGGGTGIHIDNENARGYCYLDKHRIYNNFIANVSWGIHISNEYQRLSDSSCSVDDMHIYNNTVVDCNYNFHVNDGGYTNWSGNYFYNNLIYQSDWPTSGYFCYDKSPSGFTFSSNYFNSLSMTGNAANNAILKGVADAPIVKSTGWDTIAAGAITWSNYLTDYFGLVEGSACINEATNLTDVNDPGGAGNVTDIDVTDPLWFYGDEEITIGADEITLTSVTGDNLAWTGAETIADNDLVYYRHFSGGLPDIGADEFAETFTPTYHAWYKFEAGDFETDSSIYGNDLTNTGAAADTTHYAEGSQSADFEVDDTNDQMCIADADLDSTFPTKSTYTTNKDFTVLYWVRFETLPAAGNARSIWNKTHNTNNERSWSSYIYNNAGTTNFKFAIGYNGGTQWDTEVHSDALALGRWYHVAMVFDSIAGSDDAVHIRVFDGSDGNTPVAGDTPANTDGSFSSAVDISLFDCALCFSVADDGGNEQDGQLDDVRFYNSKLTDDQIDAVRDEAFGTSPALSTSEDVGYTDPYTTAQSITISIASSEELFVTWGAAGRPYRTLETGRIDAIAYYSGKTATTLEFTAALTARMASADLTWKDADVTLPTGATIKNAQAENADIITLDTDITGDPVVDIHGAFSIRVGPKQLTPFF